MKVIGIDPGFTGAIACMDGNDACVFDLPVREVRTRGKKARKAFDEAELYSLLHDCAEGGAVAYLELAQASSRMGVVSSFRYGEGFGLIRGTLASLGVHTVLLPANSWQRYLGLVTPGSRELGRNEAREKRSALELARKLYPQLADRLRRKKDDGRAEALLIAHYGCEQLEAAA